MISHPFAGQTDDCSSSCRDRFASDVLYHNSGRPCVATVCYRLSSVAAERWDGVSETNPDKHGRTFHLSVPLCLCVINLQTKGAKRTAVRDSGLSRPNATPAATPQNNANYALKSSAYPPAEGSPKGRLRGVRFPGSAI